jgi:hypothetical protein
MRMKGRRTGDYAVTGIKASGQHFPLEGTISSLTENGPHLHHHPARHHRAQAGAGAAEQSYSQLRELSAALQTIREEAQAHRARAARRPGPVAGHLRGDLALLQRQASSAAARKLQKAWMNC